MKITASPGAVVIFLNKKKAILRFRRKHYDFYYYLRISVLLPIMMPFGSTGGCQTTLSSVRRTSGNTSFMGGPGTKSNIQR